MDAQDARDRETWRKFQENEDALELQLKAENEAQDLKHREVQRNIQTEKESQDIKDQDVQRTIEKVKESQDLKDRETQRETKAAREAHVMHLQALRFERAAEEDQHREREHRKRMEADYAEAAARRDPIIFSISAFHPKMEPLCHSNLRCKS